MVKVKATAADFARGDDYPGLTEELVAHLEALFPPRCMYANEDPNAHQRYAGKVELVQVLRDRLDNQAEEQLNAVLGDEADTE